MYDISLFSCHFVSLAFQECYNRTEFFRRGCPYYIYHRILQGFCLLRRQRHRPSLWKNRRQGKLSKVKRNQGTCTHKLDAVILSLQHDDLKADFQSSSRHTWLHSSQKLLIMAVSFIFRTYTFSKLMTIAFARILYVMYFLPFFLHFSCVDNCSKYDVFDFPNRLQTMPSVQTQAGRKAMT